MSSIDTKSSITNLLRKTAKQLSAVSDTATLDAEVLLVHALNLANQQQTYTRTYLRTWPEYQLTTEQFQLFNRLLEKRLLGTPVAYIVGHREFWSLELKVNENTLIPRPDTETLVETALSEIPKNADWDILDLGTGSGAIALAIASERPNSHVFAMDYSFAALQTAQQNAKHLGLTNLHFFCGNWLQAVSKHDFQLIVSNPPYIHQDDPHLKQGDVQFEPLSALASGKDGLDDIRQILLQASHHLLSGCRILFEHGYNQAASVKLLLEENHYLEIEQHRDLSGTIRVSSGKVPSSSLNK